MVIFISLSLTGISIIGSFLIIYFKYTSNLNENDLRDVNNFIHSNGNTDLSINLETGENFMSSDRGNPPNIYFTEEFDRDLRESKLD